MIATSTTADRHEIKMRWSMFAFATGSWMDLARSVLGGGSRGTGANTHSIFLNTGVHNNLRAVCNRASDAGSLGVCETHSGNWENYHEYWCISGFGPLLLYLDQYFDRPRRRHARARRLNSRRRRVFGSAWCGPQRFRSATKTRLRTEVAMGRSEQSTASTLSVPPSRASLDSTADRETPYE